MVELSKRLGCVVGMVEKGAVVADIGCDHGFVSIYLIQAGLADKVFALDVRMGPLSRAIEHIQRYGLSDQIETRLSDGMQALNVEDGVDTIILAGMGGRLMQDILEAGFMRNLKPEHLILQPQSHQQNLRAFLRNEGYEIKKEDMILEDGKFYPVISVFLTGNKADTDNQEIKDIFGPLLLKDKHPVLFQYLKKEELKFDQIIQRMTTLSSEDQEVLKKQQEVKAALKIYF